ncbi:MAG: PorP/SprF family type IX secretion system membrane protein [Cytophagales bacterium]|nr:PorP/SprF family type IX secretion system membrane protein [Cytophagales bacterium]
MDSLRSFLIFYALSCCTAFGQNVVYNHFFNNPYVFNPAEVGSGEFTNFTLNHRQQWRGIEGAPQVSTFTFQHPSNYKGLSFGAFVNNFERGLIVTNDVYGTVGTTAFLTKTSTLHFGLSLGVTSTSIDFNEIDDPDDPILSEFLDNNLQLTGNFGIKLRSASGVNFGISLPRLLENNLVNASSFDSYNFSPFDEVNVMLYYRKRFDKKIVKRRRGRVRRRVDVKDYYAPLQFYVLYKYAAIVDDRIELMATLNLGQNLWVGGSYRLNYGPTGLFGIKIDKFNFSYAYEPANDFVSGFANGTHELQVSLNIGERRKLERTPPILKTVQREQKHEARFSKTDIDEGGQKQSRKVFYVVLKSFNNFNAADDLVRRLREQEIDTDIFYNQENKKFYVYIYKTSKIKEANAQRKAVQELTKFRSVTIITVTE